MPESSPLFSATAAQLLIARTVACFVWLICLSGAPAFSQVLQIGKKDGVVERYWLDDPKSSLTALQALDSEWTPFEGALSRGFKKGTTWVRLKLDPSAAGAANLASDHRLVLRIMPGRLGELVVYETSNFSRPYARTGEMWSAQVVNLGMLDYSVVFPEVKEPFEVLIRLRTQSTHTIAVEALRWDQVRDLQASRQTMIFAYLVYSLMVVIWAALTWLERRDTLYLLFLFHQFSGLLVSITLLGVLRVFGTLWLKSSSSLLTAIAIPLHALCTLLFQSRLLRELGANKVIVSLVQLTLGPPVLGILLIGLGLQSEGLQLTHTGVLVGMVFVTAGALTANASVLSASDSSRLWARSYVIFIYVLMAVMMLPHLLRVLDLVPAGSWATGPLSYLGFLIYVAISPILLGSLLLMHGLEARRRRRYERAVFERVRQEAEIQRGRAAEQAELMTMLTHELKTPLSVVNLALSQGDAQPAIRERAKHAVDDMRNVIDRCAQAALVDDEFTHQATPATLQLVSVELIVSRVLSTQLQSDRVKVDVQPGLQPCTTDRQILLVIIGNLMENALKYSPNESLVRVTLSPGVMDTKPCVELRFSNRVGVAGRPDSSMLFEKYHRGTRARHRSGSGLGLYLSRQLSLRIGADIALSESHGDEVCFVLRVPC